MGLDALQWVFAPPLSLNSLVASHCQDVVVLLPIFCAALSVLHLSFHALHVALIKKRSKLSNTELGAEDIEVPSSYVGQLGGRGVYTFRVVRAVFALALFASVGVVQVVCGEGVRTLINVHNVSLGDAKSLEVWGMFGVYVCLLSWIS